MLKYPTQSFSSLSFALLIFICLSVPSNKAVAALNANAGPDQVVTAGVQVQLDGTGSSESDGTIASYHWFQVRGPVVTLEGSRTAVSSFQAPANAELEFVLRLVSDTNEVATDRVVILTDPYTNISPQANAGIDQTVSTGELVQLDGTASSDADGLIAKYRWYQKRGPTVQLSDVRSATPSFQAPPNAQLAFTLKVEDNSGAVATDSVVILVEPYTNQSPVAVAGDDLTASAGESVTLDGSASNDADGTIVQYIWQQNRGPSVVLQNSRTPTSSFMMPADAELVFTLSVIDDSGAITRDSIVVRSTTNNNQPPNADAGADQTAIAGDTVQLDGSASSDADGSIVIYNWRQNRGPSVVLQDARTVAPSFVMPANAVLAFTLIVTDNLGAVTRDTIVVRSAINNNQPPTANAGSDLVVLEGELVHLDGSTSSDPDGAISRFIWSQRSGPTIQLSDKYSAAPSFVADTAGEIVLRLVVEDDRGTRVADDIHITVEMGGNMPPIADAGPDATHLETRWHQFNGRSSSDSDGTIVSYLWEQISGPPINISATNASRSIFSANMPEVDQDTELRFRLTVTDDGGLSSSDEIAILVLANLPPQPLMIEEVTIVEGSHHVLDASHYFSFQNEDGFMSSVGYQWRQISGPSVPMQYRQYRQQVRILAPQVDVTADLIFEVTVEDRFGLPATNTVTVHVINTEDLPLNSPPVANAGEDRISPSKYYLIVDGSDSQDADGEIASYEWSVIDSPGYVGTFRGDSKYPINHAMIFEPGDYILRLTVTDDRGGVSSDDVVITFSPYVNSTASPPRSDAGVHLHAPYRYWEMWDSIRLDGRNSSDANGSIVSYQWRQISGPKVDISNPTGSYPSFVPQPFDGSVSSSNPIEYRFLLTVIDSDGDMDEDFVRHQVTYQNSEPYAIFDQQPVVSLAGSTVQLNATRSYDNDPNDYISTFHWQQLNGPAVTFLDATVEPQVVMPQLNPQLGLQQIRLGLDVEDLYGLRNRFIKEYTLWVVSPDYNSGWFEAGSDITAFSGNQVDVTGTTLAEGECIRLEGCTFDPLQINWIQLAGPPVEFIQDRGMTMSFTAPQVAQRETLVFGMAHIDRFCINSTCNSIVNDVDLVRVTIVPEGAALVAVAGPDQEHMEFTQTILDGSGSYDSSGTIIKYAWKQLGGPGALITDSTAEVTEVLLPTVNQQTAILFELTITNDLGEQAVDTLSVNVLPDLDDGDLDGDGVPDIDDLFPDDPTAAYDFDSDGVSDGTDQDYDGDGVVNDMDFYPNDPGLQTAPLLTVSSPINGSEINDDYVIVRGTLEAPVNSGVTVNGVIAEISGNPFGSEFAVRVPIEMGVNELEVNLTTVSDKQVSQALTVNRTGSIPYKFYVSERNGIDRIENQLTIVNTGADTIIQVDVDFEGDGSIDQVLVDNFEERIPHIYDYEGIYFPQVTVTDSNGFQYTIDRIVNVVSSSRIDQLLQEQWVSLNDALIQGNHKLATGFMIDHEKEAYGEIFYLLLPRFSAIIQSHLNFQPINVYSNYASYLLNRDINGVNRAFFVTYQRDLNGVWRLSGM